LLTRTYTLHSTMTTTHSTESSEQDEHHRIHTVLKNRVPEISVVFWIIKVLSTTTGETFADYLNETVGLGLPNTTYIMMSIFIVALAAQFYVSRYNAFVYWFVVVLVSIVGTLVTDNLTDGLGVPLWVSTIVFGILLFLTFGGWYWKERTLNFHTIYTRRREAFYWVAILFTFALGTAGGDLITEGWGLGYWGGVGLFGGLIALDTAAWYFLKANGVACFWVAYILTRPFGASVGDLLSQDKADGGLGVGTVITSAVFLSLIVVLTIYLQVMISHERSELEATKAEPTSEMQDIELDSEVP
jgi:uncharacterized membrane-anchored protein